MDPGRPGADGDAPAAEAPASAPTPRPRRRRWLQALIAALALLAIAGLGAVGWLVMVYADAPGPGQGRVVGVTLEPGIGPSEVADRLAEVRVVRHPWLWALYARLLGAQGRFRRGEVLVHDAMPPRALLQRLARGFGAAEVRVTFPEGFDRFDMAARLERWGICGREAFLRATEDRALLSGLGIAATSAEGYLFPDTYALHDALGPATIVRRMIDNWKRRTAPLLDAHRENLGAFEQSLGWGIHELVVLASVVEKEAAVHAEKPTIAGVFLNRMQDEGFVPKRLQADPTVAYGCVEEPARSAACRGFDGLRVTRAMLSDASNPYNTYRHAGLPPGPICNPGIRSLRAVLAPADHDYFYFVASGDGRHRFSVSLDEHNQAVDELLRANVEP